MDPDQKELEKLMLEKFCKTAQEEYLKNPTDVDNLTRWGAALLELSQFGSIIESKNNLREAVSKLEEALTINPAKHEALFCLGTVHNTNAFLTPDHDEAKILFDEAFQCFRKAVNESPETQRYLQSLADDTETRALHKKLYTQGLGQAQQTSGGGPAASASATGSAKNNSSEIKYDICGWVILAVGIFTWIGMTKSQMHPPPAR